MTTVVRKVITAISRDGQAFSEVHSETQLGERWLENDPTSLAAAGDEAAAWKAEYNAAVEAEREALAAQVAEQTASIDTLTAARDAALADVAALTAQVAELTAELDALQNPPANPRHVAPFDFLALFTAEELYGVLTSPDPTVTVGRAKLQTIITFVDLDFVDTVQLVNYLESVGLIGVGRAAQILAGEQPA